MIYNMLTSLSKRYMDLLPKYSCVGVISDFTSKTNPDLCVTFTSTMYYVCGITSLSVNYSKLYYLQIGITLFYSMGRVRVKEMLRMRALIRVTDLIRGYRSNQALLSILYIGEISLDTHGLSVTLLQLFCIKGLNQQDML